MLLSSIATLSLSFFYSFSFYLFIFCPFFLFLSLYLSSLSPSFPIPLPLLPLYPSPSLEIDTIVLRTIVIGIPTRDSITTVLQTVGLIAHRYCYREVSRLLLPYTLYTTRLLFSSLFSVVRYILLQVDSRKFQFAQINKSKSYLSHVIFGLPINGSS